MKDIIFIKLTKQLNPTFLEVLDESYLHRGHGGYREGVQTHLKIKIASNGLKDISKIAAHRLINNILNDEFAAGMHALSIELV